MKYFLKIVPRARMKLPLMALGLSFLAGPCRATVPPAVEKITVGRDVVTIYRDRYGVPRVFSGSLHALFVGNGYAVAEDRAWQMEKYRLDARGRLAEVFGPRLLEHDKGVRREGESEEDLRTEFRRLPPNIQAILQAYLEGVNRFLDQAIAAHALPAPFGEYHWTPAHWTIEDTMAIGGMMGRRFGAGDANQLRNQAVVEYLEKRVGSRQAAMDLFNDIAWTNDPAAIPTVGWDKVRAAASSLAPPHGARGELPGFAEVDPSALGHAAAQAEEVAVYAAARDLGLATRWGSYSWALAPFKTVSGAAMLVGGPQMGFATPQIAHEIQLTGPGVEVMGMGFVGIPGVLIGANAHMAWTSTSGESHNLDIYAEKLKPGDPHQYLHRGSYQPMEHRVEHILVRGGAPVDFDIYSTVHGPVIDWPPGSDTAYSLAMPYFGKEWETTIAFIDLNTATHIQEIPSIVARIASMHNIIAATQDGHIGFWHGGFFPKYPNGADPRFPLDGTGAQDWLGMMPFSANPQVIDPPSGIIFNWNNKPAASWPNYDVPAWGVAQHISDIRNTLEEELKARGGKLSYTDVQAVAPIIGRRNDAADWLKPALIDAAARAAGGRSAAARAAIDYLRHWDNQMSDGSVAETIFEAWLTHLRDDIFRPALGDLGSEREFERFIDASTIDHALAGSASSVPLSHDFLNGRTADEVHLKALDEAVNDLSRSRGPDMTAWQYHPGWIKFDPLPPIPNYDRGTYIQTVLLARPRIHGDWILPPGESEDPASPHYGDQRELASWWMYAPMQLLTEAEARAAAASSPGGVTAPEATP